MIAAPIVRKTFFSGDYLRVEDHSANNDRLTVPCGHAEGDRAPPGPTRSDLNRFLD